MNKKESTDLLVNPGLLNINHIQQDQLMMNFSATLLRVCDSPIRCCYPLSAGVVHVTVEQRNTKCILTRKF